MKIRAFYGLLALAFLLAFSSQAYAKITIEPGFTGTILITSPDGSVKLVDSSSEMPEIVSGSILDAIDSNLAVKTEGGDSVSVGCLGSTVSVSGGASAGITCSSSEGGSVKALKGELEISDAAGNKTVIPEGTEYAIQPAVLNAPATADIPTNGQPASGASDVDSRNIESSPSR